MFFIVFILAQLMPEHLENAIVNNDYHYVEQRLNQFDPVPANSVNEAFQTGLMIACLHMSVETVKVFLKKSTDVESDDPSFCNVNVADASGWTALHYASQSGSFECVKLLIEHSADIDASTDKNETPLHIAAQSNCFEILQLLVENKANINAKTNEKETTLHIAAKNNFFKIVQILIENKADIDATTNIDETALFLATQHNHPDIVEFLVENNCQLQAKALYKKPEKYSRRALKKVTVLEVAIQQNFAEIAKCLLFHLIGRNQLKEEQLNELLVEAVEDGHTKIAHDLIIKGAYVNYSRGFISNHYAGSS
jgi:ankyrin repeat protein